MALYGALVFLFTRTYADADLWGHVRFGMDMVGTRSIPAADSYSFTSDVPWVNHEWLAEVLMGGAYLAAGDAGLVLLKLLIAGFVSVVLFTSLHGAGWRGRYLDVVLTLGLLTTFFRLQFVRPQLFSVACFTALLLIIREHGRGRHGTLWLLPLLFVVWVNSHGGFVVGLGVLGLWAAVSIASTLSVRQAFVIGLAVAASFLATLVNPYGAGLWRFIRETVGLSRPEILDWIPLWRFPLGILLLEFIFPVVVVASLVRSRRMPPVVNIAIAAVLGLAMLKVSRLDAFFHLSLAILILPYGVISPPARAESESFLFGLLRAAAIVGFSAVAVWNMTRVAIGTAVPERDAVTFVRDATRARRVLTWYNWGQYAIWHLQERGIKVSMDGRRETVYSDRVVDDHFGFYRGEDAFLDYPERIGADAIWLPADFPVIPRLLARGWQTAYRSEVSVVLLPRIDGREVARGRPDRGKVFPGP